MSGQLFLWSLTAALAAIGDRNDDAATEAPRDAEDLLESMPGL